MTGGTIYGGSSLQDTAGGNDTLGITAAASSVKFDLAGGTNYASATANVTTSSIYGGTGNDTPHLQLCC